MKNLFLIYQKGCNGVYMSSIRVFDNLVDAGKYYLSLKSYGSYFCGINDDGTSTIIKDTKKEKKLTNLFENNEILKKEITKIKLRK
jgi:hypothetical protein